MQMSARKTGSLKIMAPTVIGEFSLQPGEYEVKHFDSVRGHYVESALVTRQRVSRYAQYKRRIVARVERELQPLKSKVRRTSLLVTAADNKVIGLQIRGENAQHAFRFPTDERAVVEFRQLGQPD
jgi:hypothetical protein